MRSGGRPHNCSVNWWGGCMGLNLILIGVALLGTACSSPFEGVSLENSSLSEERGPSPTPPDPTPFLPEMVQIKYGANNSYYMREFAAGSTVFCANSTFGGDPIFGTAKGCYA